MRKTEFWLAALGVVGSILAVVMESSLLTAGTVPYVIIGGVATVISYITGRSYVKGAEARAIQSANEKFSLRTTIDGKIEQPDA